MINATSLKQNILRTTISLFILTLLVGCSGGSGGSDNQGVSLNDFITEADGSAGKAVEVDGAIALSWTAPVAREDQSPISMAEISGYRIYYGTKTGDYSQSVEVNDAYTDVVTLDNLILSETYYVVVTTIDTDGRESVYSDEVVLSV
jgi:hypothetical protein